MRVLTSTVLVMEAIVLGLAIPVAVVAGGQPTWVGVVLAVLAVLCVLLPGFASRPGYVQAGWFVQAAVLACGVFEPMLLGLGVVFAALWWGAIRLGRSAERQQVPGAGPAGAPTPGAQVSDTAAR